MGGAGRGREGGGEVDSTSRAPRGAGVARYFLDIRLF